MAAGLNIKNEVLYRVYLVLLLVVAAASAVAFQTFRIAVMEGKDWREQKESLYVRREEVKAPRGNIRTVDGSLLATSLPFFEIRADLVTIDEELFEREIDSLALCLATYVDHTYTPGGYKDYLIQEREAGNRYLRIKSKATYAEKEFISRFPIFREGQFRGGFIARPTHNRMYPFRQLARRTVGYNREDIKGVGLEGYFDEYLRGESGERLVFKAGDAWIPVNDFSEIEPRRGDDIVSTLDVNIQDITHEALLQALNYHNAESGTAIVMDVQTGAIKAISNLGRTKSGWYEVYNYAVGSALEPGSTFKMASVMALLEDGHVDLLDTIPVYKGKMEFYDEEMSDAVYHEMDSTSLLHAFEISSNVGIASLVQTHYGETSQAAQFIERIKQFNLHLPTGIEIKGEAAPFVKEAYNIEDHQWSGTTLPWMSIGYEVTLTPLQLLTFYNAIANDGRMMKPFLVHEICHGEKVRKVFRPTVVKKQLASEETIAKAQELLEHVVRNGTAKKLAAEEYDFAGKTGTAQINYRDATSRTRLRYRASFVGYFPAEQPRYSCIVVITDPREHGRYGSEVAGPVFRRIADEIYERELAPEQIFNLGEPAQLVSRELPAWQAGWRPDFDYLLEYFALPYEMKTEREWAVLRGQDQRDSLEVVGRKIEELETVPSVVGMGLRDAIPVLENRGLTVEITGYGRVVQQSIIPGTKARGQNIRLVLD